MIYTFRFRDKVYRIEIEESKKGAEIDIDGSRFPLEFQRVEEHLYSAILDGKSYEVGVLRRGKKVEVFIEGDLYEFEAILEREAGREGEGLVSGIQQLTSPMPSRVVKLLKKEGEEVEEGEGVVVIEAMKMESELKSSIQGKIKDLKVKEGDAVEGGTVLLIIDSEENTI